MLTINNQTIHIPKILELQCQMTEPWMIPLFERLLPQIDGSFLDVGVNLGQTLIKLKSLDRDRVYIGFEPNPTCFFYVHELIKVNQFEHCTILPIGLFTSDRLLMLEFLSDQQAETSASLIPNFRPQHEIQQRMFVPVFQLESVEKLLDLSNLGFIKIDVEGAELEVIQTLYPLLERDRPILLLEVLPAYSIANTLRITRQTKLEMLLKQAHYSLLRVQKNDQDDFIYLEPTSMIGVHSELNLCDYLVIPSERMDTLNGLNLYRADQSVEDGRLP